jgi:hypothetical protein
LILKIPVHHHCAGWVDAVAARHLPCRCAGLQKDASQQTLAMQNESGKRLNFVHEFYLTYYTLNHIVNHAFYKVTQM